MSSWNHEVSPEMVSGTSGTLFRSGLRLLPAANKFPSLIARCIDKAPGAVVREEYPGGTPWHSGC